MVRFGIELISVGRGQKLSQQVREALVSGFFMQVAYKVGRGYITIKYNQQASIHPSCGLSDRPEWVLFNEFTQTNRPYIRTVTPINPEW
jgi:pre-mRNA-splicing factor ATP-dependent RNA helicase DHX15/PRP43